MLDDVMLFETNREPDVFQCEGTKIEAREVVKSTYIIVCSCENFALVDVVRADSLHYLSFDEMADTNLCSDGNSYR